LSLRMVAQVHLEPDAAPDARETVAECLGRCASDVDEIARAHAGLHLEGSVGGGDLTWDVLFRDEAALRAFFARVPDTHPDDLLPALGGPFEELSGSIDRIEAALVEPLARHVGRPGLIGVKRTLWTRLLDDVPSEAVGVWERAMQALPAEVPSIRNWSFSRIRTRPDGPCPVRWQHVWEQEYESLAALEQDYMASPYHWGHLDGFFDPESPRRIIDPWLAHLVCMETEGVLSW